MPSESAPACMLCVNDLWIKKEKKEMTREEDPNPKK
jgi:hypothetical protein